MKLSTALAIIAAAATANGYELLRDYSKGFRIGAATNTIHYSNSNYSNAMKAFNYMVAENACKFVSIQGTKGRFNFNDCDNHLKKAQELNMAFRGHALIWHSMAPKWLENEDANTLKNSIINHITTVLQHYEGKIDTWDVVNEAIDDSSNGNGWNMRKSFLYNKVPNFIDIAFQTARKVSPKTKLFYNDYNTEGIWGKSESVYQFVADLKKRNIPIDGVGIQYHVSLENNPRPEKINDLISRYCKLGVEVHITEMDVSCDKNCWAGDVEQQQGKVFTNALQACLNNSCCTGFLVWGIGDNDSWIGGDKKGLLFNANYQPKSQYTAVLNLLKSKTAASLGNGGGNGGNGGNTGGNTGSTTPTQPSEDITKKAVKLDNGYYTIKNPASGKYLRANKAGNSENVVIGSTAQKWKLTNTNDGYITLVSELGEYMIDVANGSDENNANVQIYDAYGGDAQKFVLLKTSQSNTYVIATKASNGYRVLDIEKNGTAEGSNVLQWDNQEKGNQMWVFEKVNDGNNGGNNGGNNNNPGNSCWSTALGYSCCKSCDTPAVFEDGDGKWGVENDEWCGIPKDCSNSCIGAQGYPCCKSSCAVVSSDGDGKWSIENGNWCLIDNSKC